MAQLNENAKATLAKVKNLVAEIKHITDYELVWSDEGDELDQISNVVYDVLTDVHDKLVEVLEEIEN